MKRGAAAGDKRPFKRPRPSAPVVAAAADVIMRDVGGRGRGRGGGASVALAAEKKFFDTVSVTDATTTGSVTNLNNVAAGDTALTRDGNKILCKSIQLRCSWTAESTTVNNIVRYLVVHDKNANGTAPTFNQVFETGIAAFNVASMKSIPNASRFVTLLDKTFTLNATSATVTALQKHYTEDFIKIPQNLQLTAFADGTAAVPISGSLSLLILGDVAAGATDVDVSMFARLRFIG